MRTQPTIISWRCVLALLTVMASLSLLAAGGAIATPSASDSTTVTVNIPVYRGVDIQGDITEWGQGLQEGTGDPDYSKNGADPEFIGGTESDQWLNDGDVPFCDGAVGRTKVVVYSNARCRIEVKNVPTGGHNYPTLTGPNGKVLEYYRTFAWYQNGDQMLLPGNFRTWSNPPGIDSSTWLYACVQRKGLDDQAGTYTGTIVVTIKDTGG